MSRSFRLLHASRKDKLLLDQAIGPALLTLSLVAGSVRPIKVKFSRAIEALLMSTCVVSGTFGVAGMLR